VFPSAVEEVLLRFPELSPNYRIFVDRPPNGLDQMLVEVEHHPDAAIDDVDVLAEVVTGRLAETLLVSLQTRVVAPGTIERIEAGKAKRVIDRRSV
jgi:phenylacetate-CoA ligase